MLLVTLAGAACDDKRLRVQLQFKDSGAGPEDPIDIGDAGFMPGPIGNGDAGDVAGVCPFRRTCAQAGANCGPISDGCGGLLDCGSCPANQTCGGGGVASQCGAGGGVRDGGGGSCTPRTCAQVGANCGPVGDGCGALVDCGMCPTGQICGGGGPSRCGTGISGDGGSTMCVPKTCAQLGANCGLVSDGCGALAMCGTCSIGQSCGGGGTPSVCGGMACMPRTCAQAGANCGPVSDGCGNLLDCGMCPTGQTCGGGGPSLCGTGTSGDGGASDAPLCTPKTCADLGANCGPVADGCGGLINSCGVCASPDICGGGGTPSVCGGGNVDAGAPPCKNLECQKVTCPGSGTTSLSGTVMDPAGKVPLYNVVVYVNNAPVSPIVTGATCDRCADALSGEPIATAITDTQGKFVLRDVPVGNNIPLVIQAGKWRRQVTVANVPACTDTPLNTAAIRLPRNKTEGNIPLIALSTGSADVLECLLRKIGISDSEFTNPTGTGRVHLYAGASNADATKSPQATKSYNTALGGANFPNARTLWADLNSLRKYDVVLLSCEGGQYFGTTGTNNKTAANLTAMRDYTALGGRVFASHWHNVWLEKSPSPWTNTATWNLPAQDLVDPVTATIDQTFPKGAALADWLLNVGGSPGGRGSLVINAAQHTNDGSNMATTQRWISTTNVLDKNDVNVPYAVQYFTFNTPIGTPADMQCGRVVYSDIHVGSPGSGAMQDKVNQPFPNGCDSVNLSAQEKALEFMFFDITAKVCDDKVPPPPPMCTPRTCAQAGANCGPIGDGCGGVLNCGVCTPPDTCGGGGVASVCGRPPCTARTCAQQGANCGQAGDGCGGVINCGMCTPPDTCGGGGTPNLCGRPGCMPRTCAQSGANCGLIGDGCGGSLNCGPCTPPDTCGGGGMANVCGHPACTPRTCAQAGANCGPIGDGCGNALDCGPCTPPDTCGGGGTPNVCGRPACQPQTCTQVGANCGLIGDGCGGSLNCGVCTPPETCGGGGISNVCGLIQ